MTIIQKFNTFLKKKYGFLSHIGTNVFRVQKFNPLLVISFLVIFTGLFFISSNLINMKSKVKEANLEEVTKSSDFANL